MLEGVGGYVSKRYEALRGWGGVTSVLRNFIFLANSNTAWFTVMSDENVKIIWLPFPTICSCA